MIYLDSSATTSVLPEVKQAIVGMMQNDVYGNPSSVYEFGLESKRIIEQARIDVAELINADADEIFFTPSATFANNIAIQGYMKNHDECYNFVMSNIEHSSLLDIEIKNKYKHIEKCSSEGFLTPEQFSHYKGCLISCQGANNEVGSVQPIKDICNTVHKNNNIFHSDITQLVPYQRVNVKDLNLDLATFSGHKFGALKGVGVLYKRKGIELSPIIYGTQEKGLSPGTENIYGICSIGVAAKYLNLYDYYNVEILKSKKDYLLDKLLSIDGVTLNGPIDLDKRLVNNINICIHNCMLDSQQLISVLDLMGYCCSAGSACHAGDQNPSHVLLSLGLSRDDALKSLRITLSNDNSYEELDKFYNDLKNIIQQYKIDN